MNNWGQSDRVLTVSPNLLPFVISYIPVWTKCWYYKEGSQLITDPGHRSSLDMCTKSLSHVQLFETIWTVPTSFLCLWDFSGKTTGVGCHFLLQGILLTQGSNPGLPHCRQSLYHLSHQGSPELVSLVLLFPRHPPLTPDPTQPWVVTSPWAPLGHTVSQTFCTLMTLTILRIAQGFCGRTLS